MKLLGRLLEELQDCQNGERPARQSPTDIPLKERHSQQSFHNTGTMQQFPPPLPPIMPPAIQPFYPIPPFFPPPSLGVQPQWGHQSVGTGPNQSAESGSLREKELMMGFQTMLEKFTKGVGESLGKLQAQVQEVQEKTEKMETPAVQPPPESGRTPNEPSSAEEKSSDDRGREEKSSLKSSRQPLPTSHQSTDDRRHLPSKSVLEGWIRSYLYTNPRANAKEVYGD